MIIITHIALALGALALSVINYLSPSLVKLRSSYALATSTLTSGLLLVIIHHASILRTCLVGILFFGAVNTLNEAARRKLVTHKD